MGQKATTKSLTRMAALSDCFPSSSCLLLREYWNLVPNDNSTHVKETKTWLPFKTLCSLSVPGCAAYHKGVMDLSSLYVSFSHFIARDVLMGIFILSFHKLGVHLHVHKTIPWSSITWSDMIKQNLPAKRYASMLASFQRYSRD